MDFKAITLFCVDLVPWSASGHVSPADYVPVRRRRRRSIAVSLCGSARAGQPVVSATTSPPGREASGGGTHTHLLHERQRRRHRTLPSSSRVVQGTQFFINKILEFLSAFFLSSWFLILVVGL